MRINQNISALNAHRLLNVNTTAGSKTLEKLSSGKRINRAGDDAAGMAISEKMRAQIKGLQVASRNSLDGVSLVQTAEGAMSEIHSMLQRMRELSVQAANGTSAESDRQAIQDEINQLTSEVNRIANGTEYNTRNILKGNQGPNANAVVHRMSTGESAQTRGNVDVNSMKPPKFDLKSEQLSVFIDGEEKVVNLTGTNVSTTKNDFMQLLNDALGDTAKAIIDKSGQIEITTSSIGGLSNIEIKGSTDAINMFYTDSQSIDFSGTNIKGVNTVSSTLVSGTTSKTSIDVAGATLNIQIKGDSSGFSNDINIKFTEGDTEGAKWLDNKLTVTLESDKTDYLDTDIENIIKNAVGVIPKGLDKDSLKVSNTSGTIDLSSVNLKTPQNSLPESTLTSGISSGQKVTIGGVELTINSGPENAANDSIEIEFTEGASAKAEFSGNKLTVTLDQAKQNYKPADIESLIRAATGSPTTGIDKTKIHVVGAGTIDMTTVDLITVSGGHPVEATLKNGDTGVSAEINTTIAGKSLTINAGGDNGNNGNITIVFMEDPTVTTVGSETAKWDGTTLTIGLKKDETSYDQTNILNAIKKGDIFGKPTDLDMSKFTSTQADNIDLSTVDLTKSIGGSISTILPKSVSSETTVVAAGLELKILAGAENGELGNIDIKFKESDTEGYSWSENALTINLEKGKIYTANSIQIIINGANNGNPYPNIDTGKFLDMTKFTVTKLGDVGSPIQATLNKATSSESTANIAGTEIKISAGTYNGDLGNTTVKITQGKAEGYKWDGDKLTITLDESKAKYNISDIESIIKGAEIDKPIGLDMAKFTVKGVIDFTAEDAKKVIKSTGKAENATSLSTGSFYFNDIPEVGSTIQVGNEVIEFFNSNIAPYVGSNRPIDIAGKENAEAIVDEIVNKFSNGIEGVTIEKDSNFDSGATPATSKNARLIIKSNKPGFDGNLIYLEGTSKDFTTNLQVGANTGQGFRLQIGDIRAKNLKISADNQTRNPGMKGAAYRESPTVTDGISSSIAEHAVDVTTEERASAAIKVFDNAIVQIATERSKLGATQNRLEHTISNLDNTAENLTAAMSRIEDTDMALEMSNFQKLNVLQQAGISMLAQANQQPQSILKLLG